MLLRMKITFKLAHDTTPCTTTTYSTINFYSWLHSDLPGCSPGTTTLTADLMRAGVSGVRSCVLKIVFVPSATMMVLTSFFLHPQPYFSFVLISRASNPKPETRCSLALISTLSGAHLYTLWQLIRVLQTRPKRQAWS